MKPFELSEMINKLELFKKTASNAASELSYEVAVANLKFVLLQDCNEVYNGNL